MGDGLSFNISGDHVSFNLSGDVPCFPGDDIPFNLLGIGFTDVTSFGPAVCLVVAGDGLSINLSEESADVFRDKLSFEFDFSFESWSSSEAFWSSAAFSCAVARFSAKAGLLNSAAAMYVTHAGSNEVGFW